MPLLSQILYNVPVPEALLKIVDLELAKAGARTGLLRRRITLDVEPEARARLAELGYADALAREEELVRFFSD